MKLRDRRRRQAWNGLAIFHHLLRLWRREEVNG